MRYLLGITILQFVLMRQVVADEKIGRLFFTSEQRQHLQHLRKDSQHDPVVTEADADEVKNLLATLPQHNTQGYVKRNDGKQITRWVNGKPLQDDEIE